MFFGDSKGDETGSPEMTEEYQAKINKVLDISNGAVSTDDELILELLEDILPDPQEDEDASKSLWDTLIELHGRDMVKFNETNRTKEWRVRCLVARLILHFDFIIYGIVTEPIPGA